jgi:hypothetical protein
VTYSKLKSQVVHLASATIHQQLFEVLVPGYTLEPHNVLDHIWQSYVDQEGTHIHLTFRVPANLIAMPQYFQWAGESHRHAAIFSTGRRIPSPRHHLFSGPANLIAMTQSFQWAGKPNRFRGPAHSIAKPPNLISAGASSSCLLYHSNSILKARIIIELRQH